MCAYLAPHNEVWGIARFSVPGSRDEVEAMGVTTRVVDLGDADFRDVPDDFTYVLHLAAAIGPSTDYDLSLRVNAEATGLLLNHCRKAKAALVMSTASVYKPHADPRHLYLETDALGEAVLPGVPTYSITKIAEEAVARYCARALELPVTIARMNTAYSARGGLPAYHLDAIAAGKPVIVRNDPCPYSPIHQDDINEQVAALLDAATVPATIVNWGGDDAGRPARLVRGVRRAHGPHARHPGAARAGEPARHLDRQHQAPRDHRSVPRCASPTGSARSTRRATRTAPTPAGRHGEPARVANRRDASARRAAVRCEPGRAGRGA